MSFTYQRFFRSRFAAKLSTIAWLSAGFACVINLVPLPGSTQPVPAVGFKVVSIVAAIIHAIYFLIYLFYGSRGRMTVRISARVFECFRIEPIVDIVLGVVVSVCVVYMIIQQSSCNMTNVCPQVNGGIGCGIVAMLCYVWMIALDIANWFNPEKQSIPDDPAVQNSQSTTPTPQTRLTAPTPPPANTGSTTGSINKKPVWPPVNPNAT